MKLSTLFTLSMLAMISGNALAQKKPELPDVQAPRELVEVGSEYVEGTITRLSEADVSQFIPWAQNAQSVLTKALRDIETMPVDQQVRHLTATIKSVVQNSGQKNYQMFMRFALNRTLLLVQELTFQADWNIPGTAENALDLQIKGIELALKFYESDLAYQNRVNRGNDTVNLNYGMFGSDFGKTMFRSIQNITDASAQYRLLYKTLEMTNWDFSRDAMAVDISDTIVEIYHSLNSMDEIPGNVDSVSIQSIRRLNILVQPVEGIKDFILKRQEKLKLERDVHERQARAEIFHRQIKSELENGIVVLFPFSDVSKGTLMTITGFNYQERYNTCISLYPNLRTIYMVITFGNRNWKYLKKESGFWDKSEGCHAILSSLDSLSPLNAPVPRVHGKVGEGYSYNFSGPTVSSFLSQCSTFKKSVSRYFKVSDEITMGINDQVPVILPSSIWIFTLDFCLGMLSEANRLGNSI